MGPDVREVLRYLRIPEEAPETLREQVEREAEQLAEQTAPRYTYRAFPISRAAAGVELSGSGVTLAGGLAEKMLRGCDRAVLLACTLGVEFEAKLHALERRDMSRAVILDACGSAWVESGCDAAEQEIAARFPGRFLTDRFSPGYGDLPLSIQSDILAALDARRRLGIYIGESLLMLPSKSVTAIVGVSDTPQPARVRGCGYCAMKENCDYRKGGTTCAV